MRIGIKEVTNPLEVLECIVAFDVRDYGSAKRDRMLYAIILGWDDASYKSFGWSEEEIKEWKQMRERFERLKEVDFSTADVVPKSEVEQLEYEKKLIFDEGASWHRTADSYAKRMVELQGELEKAKIELDTMRGAANTYKMHYENARKEIERLKDYNTGVAFNHYFDGRKEVAREIFEEIEEQIDRGLSVITKILNAKGSRANGKTVLLSKYDVFREAKKYIAELKKKYTEGENNQ